MSDSNDDLRWRVRERLGEVLRAEARDALGFADGRDLMQLARGLRG
jgi:hypothetical protein